MVVWEAGHERDLGTGKGCSSLFVTFVVFVVDVVVVEVQIRKANSAAPASEFRLVLDGN